MEQRKIQAPFVRRTDSVRTIMRDTVLALCVLLVVPIYYSGARVLMTSLACVLCCGLCEVVFGLIARTPIKLADESFAVTGLSIALLHPVSAPLWLPLGACVFAMMVAKLPFGGTGRTPFHPTAAGMAFVTVCFPQQVFEYISPAQQQPLFGAAAGEPVRSGAQLLSEGMRPAASVQAVLYEPGAGPVGQTALLVLLAAGIYLVVRRAANWDAPLCFIGAAAAMAACFPRMVGARWESVLFELTAGSLLFYAVFIVSETSTSPHTRMGRCFYGALCGVLTMLMRYNGGYEQCACFAVLFLNAFSPAMDRLSWKLGHWEEWRRKEGRA